ncbi:beta-propeller domain-containing protein [Candidatus Woesearchaeota archaeon]|nr:beta-propeller domain-containing protein [Candidatus Woesearchaeota archaeon]
MKEEITTAIGLIAILAIGVFALTDAWSEPPLPNPTEGSLPLFDRNLLNNLDFSISEFKTCSALKTMFKERPYRNVRTFGGIMPVLSATSVTTAQSGMKSEALSITADSETDFSTTNIQVEGVDEADIIKTDGKYIYLIANNKFIIARAYPVEKAKIISTTELNNFYPNELFIDQNRAVLVGSTNYNYYVSGIDTEIAYPRSSVSRIIVYDTTDKTGPEVKETHEFEGSYLTSRKIGNKAYFVINSYPRYNDDIIPLYRTAEEQFEPLAKCGDIRVITRYPTNFVTIASINIMNGKLVDKQTVAASAQNVYASLENIYIAETNYERQNKEATSIHKFNLYDGEIKYQGSGDVPGNILNQFSMDEHKGYFRIATTQNKNTVRMGSISEPFPTWTQTNNLYVLDEDLDMVGSIEDLAPGEKIYSVRYMGNRAYIVTFKKVDPLFVIDLSNPKKPNVLGKLKIPGYSDYLHPYDENHLIGIGKDTVEAEQGNFAWYQGIKMAIFDVTDVNHPKELHKTIIGDRGTESPALHNHKAFLFDKEKGLLALPITLAEIKDKSYDNQYGEYTFQGAYVWHVDLEEGFQLRGKITHHDNDETFKKSGYYYRSNEEIQRTLFVEDVLYTLSNKRLQLNSMDDLETLRRIQLPGTQQDYGVIID